MLDYVIKSGTVYDGSGADSVQADVGIRDGTIVSVGAVSESARETVDADGKRIPEAVELAVPTEGAEVGEGAASP